MTKVMAMESIGSQIFLIRGRRVMLDADLAALYGVQTSNLNKAVKRNIERFPDHFMFQVTKEEFKVLKASLVGKSLIFQIGISNKGRGGRRLRPFAFTEQGVAMLSSVLRSQRAIQVNIAIMDAFVRIREMMGEHAELVRKINAMEKKYDTQFRVVFDAIRELMTPPKKKRKEIGFRVGDKK